MRSKTEVPTNIDDYISRYPPAIQSRLTAMRATIRRQAPSAEERISYRMPTFYLGGNLVHFAAFERHIGFYPGAAGIAAFQDAIAGYKNAKGSVQFPHSEPLPLKLVAAVVAFRVSQQGEKIASRALRGLGRKRAAKTRTTTRDIAP